MEEVIVVGLSYAKGDSPVYSRRRDYTPTVPRIQGYVSDMAGRAPAFGEADAYGRFIAADVFPMIAASYRADMNRKVFVGHSYGSLLGLQMLLSRPSTFEHYILGSPSLWYDGGVMFDREQDYAKGHRDMPASVYFGIGGRETLAAGKKRSRSEEDADMVADLRDFAPLSRPDDAARGVRGRRPRKRLSLPAHARAARLAEAGTLGGYLRGGLSQQLLDIARNLLRLGLRRIALHHLAIAPDQELGEVPLDPLGAQHARRFGFQVLPQWVRLVAVDVDLGEHREAHAVVLFAEGADLFLRARLLAAELVAGEAQHFEAAVVQFAVQGFESLVLRREAAFAGGVDDEEGLAAVLREVDRLAVQGGGLEVVYVHDSPAWMR
jgi:hypothetical protein